MRTNPVSIGFSRAPIGAEVGLETFDGIGLVCGELLRNLGILTISDLLRVGATERGRRRLASEIGVTYSTLLKWIYREDLLRVRGIGRKYSCAFGIGRGQHGNGPQEEESRPPLSNVRSS